jgi:small subunit ribosomal protein S21
MLIIDVKDNESIERALKRYKRKFRNTKVLNEIRDRRFFDKPSVKRRHELLKAAYKEEKLRKFED